MLATVGLRGAVDYTVAAGRITVAKGRLTGVDEDEVSREANAACARYLAKP